MSVRPRTWWLLGGCGCALVALLVGGSALLWYLWPSPAPSSKPPRVARTEPPVRHTRPFFAKENREVPTVGRTVYSGQLEPGRDVTIRCDPTLSLTVPAGTFVRSEPVAVKAASVKSHIPASIEKLLATYEVTIGAGGRLSRPVTLTFTHTAVAETDRLVAARFDPEKETWVPLRLTRRSATESVVETDHLSIVALAAWLSGASDIWQSADKLVTVYVRKDVAPPTLDALYSRGEDPRPDDTDKSPEARLARLQANQARQQRLERALARDTDTERRRMFATVVAEMVARVRAHYAGWRYPAPATLDIFVDPEFGDPQFHRGASGDYIGLPPYGHDSPETLAFNLAHELFHACQYGAGFSGGWMYYAAFWLTEASAEYAAGRVAWEDLAKRPFEVEGVAVDDALLRARMGDNLHDDFIGRRLTGGEGDHPYHGAHFLEYFFTKAPRPGGLPHLWSLTTKAGSLDGSEKVLGAYGRYAEIPFDEAWSEFVPYLLLDGQSPIADRPAMRKARNELGPDLPAWNGALPLAEPYTGAYERFQLRSASGREPAQSLVLTVQGSGAPARVVAYREGGSRPLDLSRDVPVDRAFVRGEPKVMTVPLKAGETVCIVASRGDGADPKLTLRAEVVALTVTATRLQGSASKFRLEVAAAVPIGRPLDYQWETGDPGVRPMQTPSPSLEYTYRKPGEHEVRVTLHDRNAKGALVGEAIGRVTVPSTLQLQILSAQTGRPVGGAQVRLRYEGQEAIWGTDPSGLGWVRDMPPRLLSISVEVSAEGYETHSKTGNLDMSQELVLAKFVKLKPKPRIAPPPPPKAEPPPSTPPAPPEPPRSTPVPTPTPKAAPPETSNYDACMAKHRQRLDEVRANNRAQNPASNSMLIRVMGADAQCSATYDACLAAAKERGRSCPPGPDGTFTQCIVNENGAWLDCANQEIDCSERSLEAQCRKK